MRAPTMSIRTPRVMALAALVGLLMIAMAMAAMPASAQGGNQAGDSLVNVQISGVDILVPIGVAANLCDINANVLAEQVRTGDTECEATAESIASPGTGEGGNGGNQAGDSLVNVQIEDVTVAIPIALAANICDVNINVLAQQLRTGDAECEAVAESEA